MLQASQRSAGVGMVGQLPNLRLGMFGEAVLKDSPSYCAMDVHAAAASVEPLQSWMAIDGNVGAPLPDNLIHLEDVPQRSEVWQMLRVGRVTASTISDILGIKEKESVTFLRKNGVKLMVREGSPEYLNTACEQLISKQPRQQEQISSHQQGYRACAMQMGTNGEHMGHLTFLKYLRSKGLDLFVREAGVRHLSYIPATVLGISDEQVGGWMCMDKLPPIMVSPDGYVVSFLEIVVSHM